MVREKKKLDEGRIQWELLTLSQRKENIQKFLDLMREHRK